MKTKDLISSFATTPELSVKEFSNFKFSYSFQPEEEYYLQLEMKKERLGKQIEMIAAYILSLNPHWEMMQNGLQIFENKITIGEIDFILRNKLTKKTHHVELSYKFYLLDEGMKSPTLLEKFIGPNRKDFLHLKISKFEKQLELLKHPEAEKALKKLNINTDEIIQQVWFKAQLFVPFRHNQYLPPSYQKCVTGYWIKLADFLERDEDTVMYLPQKSEWPISPQYIEQWTTKRHITALLLEKLNNKFSQLLFQKNQSGTYERFFVVWW